MGASEPRAQAGAVSPPAHLDLFGFRPTPARVVVIPRSTGWRVRHAFGYMALCWLGMGAAIIPPHLPWLLTAFFLGIFFFLKYIRQRYTLMELEGTCPKCDAPQTIRKPMRLARPQRMHCGQCHQQLVLRVEL